MRTTRNKEIKQEVEEIKSDKSVPIIGTLFNITLYTLSHPGKVLLGIIFLGSIIRSMAKPLLAETPTTETIKKPVFNEYFVNIDTELEENFLKNITFIMEAQLPPIDIEPTRKRDPQNDIISSDPMFTRDYLISHHAILEENGYFARGDCRSPDSINYNIPPKSSDQCDHKYKKWPHFNVSQHRANSDCSGMVSLTDNLSAAHKFGRQCATGLYLDHYYLFIAKMEHGIWIDRSKNLYPQESEHTAIGSLPIFSYRLCSPMRFFKCGNIFIKDNIGERLQKKIIEAQLLPFEKVSIKL